MDILLLMLLVWAYNEQPKDAVSEEPEIVPIQEVEVPDNAVNVTTVTQTAAVLTAIGEAMTGTSTATTTATSTETSTETTSVTSTEQEIIDELNSMTETTTVVPITSTTTTSSTSTSSSTGT